MPTTEHSAEPTTISPESTADPTAARRTVPLEQAPSTSPDEALDGAVTVLPLRGIGEIRAGDDLAALLAAALRPLAPRDGDVLCISTKIVSKALGLRVSAAEREDAVRAASVRLVARRRHTHVVTSVVQIPSGPVMAAAGVDSSNAPEGPLLLPEDPDACAQELRSALGAELGVAIGVLLTDTSSRVWRVGVGDIALGADGVASLQDLRGGVDADGRPLTVTVRNLADELASAADLVKGKASGVPAALVRGVESATSQDVPGRALSRTGEDDWFRRPSLESVWAALGLSPEQEPIARMSPEPEAERIERALQVAAIPRENTPSPRAVVRRRPPAERTDPPPAVVVEAADASAEALVEAATLAERIRTALGAEGLGAPLPPIAVEITVPQTQEDPR